MFHVILIFISSFAFYVGLVRLDRFAFFAVQKSSCYRPSPCQHVVFILLRGRESGCSFYR